MSTVVLTDEQTLEEVIESLVEHISVDMQGDCTEEELFTILVRAASSNDSIENTSKTLEDTPCGNDIRYHLNKCDDMKTMEEEVNTVLQSRLPGNVINLSSRLIFQIPADSLFFKILPSFMGHLFLMLSNCNNFSKQIIPGGGFRQSSGIIFPS